MYTIRRHPLYFLNGLYQVTIDNKTYSMTVEQARDCVEFVVEETDNGRDVCPYVMERLPAAEAVLKWSL